MMLLSKCRKHPEQILRPTLEVIVEGRHGAPNQRDEEGILFHDHDVCGREGEVPKENNGAFLDTPGSSVGSHRIDDGYI